MLQQQLLQRQLFQKSPATYQLATQQQQANANIFTFTSSFPHTSASSSLGSPPTPIDNNQENNNIDVQREGEEDHCDDQANAIISKNLYILQRLQQQSQYQQQNESEVEVTNLD